jgi:hypothetical protein
MSRCMSVTWRALFLHTAFTVEKGCPVAIDMRLGDKIPPHWESKLKVISWENKFLRYFKLITKRLYINLLSSLMQKCFKTKNLYK